MKNLSYGSCLRRPCRETDMENFGSRPCGRFFVTKKSEVDRLLILSPYMFICGLNSIIDKKIDIAKKDVLNKIKNDKKNKTI